MTGATADHRRWRAELAAYLLGSLEPDEIEALESHLEGCERCRDELRWLQPAIDVIPASVPQLEPPPGLRARLMAEVRSDAAELGAAGRAGVEIRRPARRQPPAARLRGFLLRPAVALTAVALIAAVAGGYALRGGGEGTGTTTTATVAQGGAVHAKLERSGDSGQLQLTGLHPLPRSRVYEAWVQRGHRISPSSLFAARRDGSASTAIPHQLAGADTVMVTAEPRGGSKQPSSSPIVSISLRG
jgi:Anti-sigma-K factor rskA/Putative zinc-finger